MAPATRPLFRWAGSKRKLASQLSAYWSDDFGRYIEPFAGSACLYFHINPHDAVLNDINKNLIAAYRAVQTHPTEIYELLSCFNISKEKYYQIREEGFDPSDPIKLAANFIYLNRNCFNGLYRTNLNGKFNVPYSGSKTPTIPSKAEFVAISKKLENVAFFCEDFESILQREVRANDYVYLDPPYAVSHKRVFREYGPDSFSTSDIPRLMAILKMIDERSASFLLSYEFSEELREAFSDWRVSTVSVHRNISGFQQHRRLSTELVVTNIN